MNWQFKPFAALTAQELYAVLQLRSEVFVVEQTCVFQDIDGTDEAAFHLTAFAGTRLVAYARCFPATVKYLEASIGRVVTHSSQRGTGLGHQLMHRAIDGLIGQWGVQPIRIGAQARLETFYRKHNFDPTGQRYLEDGIAHIEMLRP